MITAYEEDEDEHEDRVSGGSFFCWLGVHRCSKWSEPLDDEPEYQTQRCLDCNKIWERRIPVQ